MNTQTATELREWFEEYSAGFRPEGGGEMPILMRYKHAHSLRVAEDMRGMAAELGWAEGDVAAAEALGVLHDTGRFSQFAEFQSFDDTSSVNHAERGIAVLRERRVLARCPPADARHIEDGIRFHNCRELRGDIAPDCLPFVRLIRDADKLDIMATLYRTVKSGDIRNHPSLLLGISIDGPPSRRAIEGVLKRQSIGYRDLTSLADFILIQLSWLYQLEFQPAYRRVVDRKTLEHFAELLPGGDGIAEAIGAVGAFVRGRLAAMPDAVTPAPPA